MNNIHCEASYNAAISRNIKANARKTFDKNYPHINEYLYANQGNPFVRSLLDGLNKYGKLTDGQVSAIEHMMAKKEAQQAAFDAAPVTGEYVGNVGDKKVVMTLKVKKAIDFIGDYGMCFIVVLESTEGYTLAYKGSKDLGLAVDDNVQLQFTIKAHNEYRKVRQTAISYPKVVTTK